MKYCLHLLILIITLFLSLKAEAGVSEWIDFELENGHIKIPVTVMGVQGYAILDTGSKLNVINSNFSSHKKALLGRGKSFNVQGVYESEIKSSYNNVPVNLFGMDITLDNLVEANIGNSKNQLLIGAGFFKQFVVQLDYPQKKMRLIDHNSIDMKKISNIRMQLDSKSNMPIVKVELNNETSVWLMLDTGNNGGILIKRATALEYKWLERYETKHSLSTGINGMAVNDNFNMPIVKFGPYELENVDVSVPEKNKSKNISQKLRNKSMYTDFKAKNVKGILGYDILKHFVITLDYNNGRMHIFAP